MAYGFDGASPFILADAKKAGGILFTGYIVGHPGGYDPITKARVQEGLALGLGFLPNWERGAGYLVTCGRSGGKAAGQEAVDALCALDIPDGIACPFSWDVHVDPSLYRQCATVAEGILDGLNGHYQLSAYGQGGLIAYLRQAGLMKPKGWLSGSSSFPGYDRTSPHVGMYQEVGQGIPGTDRNTITDPKSLGALWPTGSPFLQEEFTVDPETKTYFDNQFAVIRDRLTALFAVDSNGDGTRDYTGTVQQAAQAALHSVLNPDKLAAQIAAKIPGAQLEQVTAAVKDAIDGATIQTN